MLKRINVKISEEMYEWVKQQSSSRGLTMNALIIFALENYYRETMTLPQLQKIAELSEQAKRNG